MHIHFALRKFLPSILHGLSAQKLLFPIFSVEKSGGNWPLTIALLDSATGGGAAGAAGGAGDAWCR